MRCWNADEFAEALTEVFRAADRVRAALEQSPPRMEDETERKPLEERAQFWLECHARDFLIDHILSALNWQLQPSLEAGEYIAANLVTEQNPDGTGGERLREETPEHRRRLDYFGYADGADTPLLVVEAKRPNIGMAGTASPLASPDGHPAARLLVTALNTMRAGTGIPKRSLSALWKEALAQLRDYCRTIAETRGDWPARAVLTNGDWIILFADPQNAFTAVADAPIAEHAILVFESREAMLKHCTLLWEQLEYASLAKIERRIQVGQVPFFVDPATIESCSYGLRVSYTYKSTNYRKAPLLSVSPLLFVRSAGASFIQVASDWDQEIPADGRGSMPEHLEQVEEESRRLKRQLEERVLGGRVLPLVPVQAHCDDREAFRVRPLVQPVLHADGKSFLVLTGTTPHFTMRTSEFAGCTFHRHAGARAHVASQRDGPVLESITDPKSYFIDGSIHHCAHKEVYGVKREQIAEANQARCGHRRAAVGSAFCEVWRFEEFLCCRTCTFHTVCSQAQAFSLPCPQVVQLTRGGVVVADLG